MPWGRLDDSLYDHPKLDRLPADRRLEAVGLWARSISWCNRFLTDGLVPRGRIDRLDGSSELADLLVAAELFETTGDGYKIHDFLEFNDSRAQVLERRAKEAKRKADYRAGKRPTGTDSGTPRSAEADVPPVVPVGQAERKPKMSRAESRRESQRVSHPSSRANPDPTRPDPTRPTESPTGESPRPRGRADVAALHDRGWKRVTAAQRAVLDEIAGRHESGVEFAAETIRNTPGDRDPLESVMAADRMWKAAQLRRADAEEAAWSGTKAEERAAAGTAMQRIGSVLNGQHPAEPDSSADRDEQPAWLRTGARS